MASRSPGIKKCKLTRSVGSHWSILCPLGIFYGHAVYFPHFVMLHQDKSGNARVESSIMSNLAIAQSFKHNQTWLGRQVCRPGLSWATNLSPSCEFQCHQLLAVHKRKRRRLVADNPVTWAGQQVCCPGLSWATNLSPSLCWIRTKRFG
jgi:hypothetical protein